MESWSPEEFTERLRAVGAKAYHDRHPFHRRMHAGELSPAELRLWAANRYYYQKHIPIKDALILSRCPLPEIRRQWVTRLADHDGSGDDLGGIERWIRLAAAIGVSRAELDDDRHLLPGVRFAVDAYVELARSRPWVEGVAASLTELFAPALMSERLAALERHYPWIDRAGLVYFRERIVRAPRDASQALSIVIAHSRTHDAQARAVDALRLKCDLLWAQLDALEHGAVVEV
jgi:pyrroloquinoline-quinone synthase